MTAWPNGALRSPLTGRTLLADSPHSIAAGDERWPVVEGIPFLRADRRALAGAALDALDAGDFRTALVLLLGDQDNWARTPPPDEAARRELANNGYITFCQAMELLAFGPVAAYFAHRWSDPTFLSGLALAEAHWTPGRVFELACGAGHYLREFARVGADAAGGDIVFAKLWLARRYLAEEARLVCFDAAAPWPLGDGSADLVFCHDAFYFLPEKAHVAAEMRRVAGTGRVLVGHAHNSLVDNLSSGSPLKPAEYAALFNAPLLYDDRELTTALVEARAPVPASVDALDEAPAIAIVSGAGAPRPVLGGVTMPSPGTSLRLNPLYRGHEVVPSPDPDKRFETGRYIVWPSERYEREYGPLVTYPLNLAACPTYRAWSGSHIAADSPPPAVGTDPLVDALARRRVLLDLPPQW